MSDYTAPNKSFGETWSADEHNDMKAAINSKVDKSSVKNTLEDPSTSTIPSTSLISSIVAASMTFRGGINAESNLDICLAPGYYTPLAALGDGWNSSFPEAVPGTICKVGLLVYSYNATLNQELTLYLERPRVFKRVCISSEFSQWVEYMTVSEAGESYAPIVLDGTPTVTLEDAPAGFGIYLNPNSKDIGGSVTITNASANPTSYIEFKVQFEFPRPNITSVGLTAGNDIAMDGKLQVVILSSTVFKAKVSANIPVGSTSVIHYGIFQNQ